HGLVLGHSDDSTGAVGRVGPLVEDVHLIGGLGGWLLRIAAADEDAAVGVIVDPELGLDLEIPVGFFRNQEALALVGLDDAVDEPPVCIAHLVPVVEILAVEQRNPTGVG